MNKEDLMENYNKVDGIFIIKDFWESIEELEEVEVVVEVNIYGID